MPTWTFTSREGKKFDVTGPDGATPEQAWAILDGQLKAKAQPQGQAPWTKYAEAANRGTTIVDVPGHGEVEFPAGMSDEQMASAIKTQLMDVRMPDGRIVQNVPRGTTKAQLSAKLNAYDAAQPKTSVYRVQGPDGRVHRIEGPDDATPEQVEAFAAQHAGGGGNGQPMVDRLAHALKQADAAGDTAGATKLAAALRAEMQRSSSGAEKGPWTEYQNDEVIRPAPGQGRWQDDPIVGGASLPPGFVLDAKQPSTSNGSFDAAGARKAGYSDTEIADHLARERNFDVAGARSAGYNDAEIVQFLSQGKAMQPKQPDVPESVGNLASGANRGLMNVLGAPIDTLANVADLGIAAFGALRGPDANGDVPQLLDRSRLIGSSNWLANALSPTGIGVPIGENNSVNRLLYAGGQGVSSGAVMGPQNALANALRGGVGSMAGTATYEATGNPLAAITASFAAPAAPQLAGAAARGAFRGGEAGRQTMKLNIDAFGRVGASPSMGQATQSRSWRALESVLSKMPGSAGVMAQRAEQQQAAIGAGAERIASNLAPKANPSLAGAQINAGISEGFLPQARATQAKLYNEIDRHIPAGTNVPVVNTMATVDRIAAGLPNAPAMSGSSLMRNNLAQEMSEALKIDAPHAALPFEALKAMRTRIGERLDSFDLTPDVPRQQLKMIYGALTEDMKNAAAISGPKAQAAFQRASNFTRAMHGRMELLEKVVDKAGGPEKVFQAVASGNREGATVLRSVMKSLPPEARETLVSSMVRRLGRATPGQQNEAGDQFSTQTFLTNWSKLSPEAKTTITGPFGPEFARDLQALASVSSNIRQGSKVFANPSGTSAALSATAGYGGIGTAAMAGQPLIAAKIGLGMGALNLFARMANNQRFVRSMAKATELPPGVISSQIASLGHYGEGSQ